MKFRADHHGFFRNGQPFSPLSSQIITLPANLSSDLNWEKELKEAAGEEILWNLDLAITSLSAQDTAAFYSYTLAIEEFAKTVYPSFKEATVGVLLFKGEFPEPNLFPRHHWDTAYAEWLALYRCSLPKWHELHSNAPSEHYFHLFCAQMLAEYLHRLLSFLPEEAIPLAQIEVPSEISPAAAAQFFSRERFEFLHIIKDNPHPSLGILLPSDPFLDSTTLALLNQAIEENKEARIIAECKLNEEWDELEELIVIPHAVSAQGERKLMGFSAAGGTIKSYESRVYSSAAAGQVSSLPGNGGCS